MPLETAVLVIGYKRPDTLEKVMDRLSAVQPKKLYFAFDGAKNKSELSKCKEAQEIVNKVAWKCDVKTNASDINLGCKNRVSSAIDWFFGYEKEGIILEDDTLPNTSFFTFCEMMLKRYRSDHRVMHISGNNFLPNDWKYEGDYYFSNIPHIWGWATWKRAWEKYDVTMSSYPKFLSNRKIDQFDFSWGSKRMLLNYFQRTFNGNIDTWDFQWTYSLLSNGGIAINPSNNLVENIGFTLDATHTHQGSEFSNLHSQSLVVKKHPKDIRIDTMADRYILEHNFGGTFLKYIGYRLKKLWHKYHYQLILFKNKI